MQPATTSTKTADGGHEASRSVLPDGLPERATGEGYRRGLPQWATGEGYPNRDYKTKLNHHRHQEIRL